MSEQVLGVLRAWGPRVLWAIVALTLGWLLAGWSSTRTSRLLARTSHVEPTLAGFLTGLVRWAILLVAAISALGLLGVQTASFAAVLGAIGVAIALGFQGTLASLAAGVLLLVFRPFRVGDTIRLGAQQGRVEAIDLFMTAIDTPDNRRVLLPNNAVFGQTIENLTFHRRRVVELTVPVPAALDLDDARRALEAAARAAYAECGAVAACPAPTNDMEGGPTAPEVLAVEVQAAAVVFRVRVPVATERLAAATHALARGVRRALDGAAKR
jgi:small conductance mechanosensitive channel